MRPCNFIKKRLQHRCFRVKFAKFLRTPVLKNICKRLIFILDYALLVLPSGLQLYVNETPAQPFSSEISEIFKNIFFNITYPVAVSEELPTNISSRTAKPWKESTISSTMAPVVQVYACEYILKTED